MWPIRSILSKTLMNKMLLTCLALFLTGALVFACAGHSMAQLDTLSPLANSVTYPQSPDIPVTSSEYNADSTARSFGFKSVDLIKNKNQQADTSDLDLLGKAVAAAGTIIPFVKAETGTDTNLSLYMGVPKVACKVEFKF